MRAITHIALIASLLFARQTASAADPLKAPAPLPGEAMIRAYFQRQAR